MRTPSRPLAALFLVALVGVLFAGGLLAARVGGLPLLAGCLLVVTALLGLGAARARRLVRPPATAQRACTCCDGDHTKPVTVL